MKRAGHYVYTTWRRPLDIRSRSAVKQPRVDPQLGRSFVPSIRHVRVCFAEFATVAEIAKAAAGVEIGQQLGPVAIRGFANGR